MPRPRPRRRRAAVGGGGSGSGAPATPVELAIRYLGRRRRFEGEVRSHLRRRGVPAVETEEALVRLRELQLVSDEETCRAWLKDRLSFAPRGRRLLRTELLRKGVAAETVEEALAEVVPEAAEVETALAVLRRAARRSGGETDAARRRLWATLGRRGFAPETCREALRRFAGSEFEPDGPGAVEESA